MIKNINQNVTLNFSKQLITCIREALEDDLLQFKQERNLATSNGIPFLKGDFINTRLQTEIAGEEIEVIPFSRYGWESRLVVDRKNKVVVNVMSKSRIEQLRKSEPSPTPHYACLFSYMLNNDMKAPDKQMSLFEDYPYSSETMEQGYEKLLGGQLASDEGYLYCVLAYELREGKVYSCELLVLDKDLDLVEKKSLNELLKPDFASLTQENAVLNESENKTPRVTIKADKIKENTALVSLRKDEKRV